MRRREVLAGLATAAWPLGLGAQPTGKPIFGILLVFSSESGRTFTDPIRAYLEALGFVDGRNIELDFRHADGNVGRLPMMATELVARRPAVIATFGDATGLAAQGATTAIPIVAMSEDLVQAKLVKDMRHTLQG
jgi:putative tryptophan/tyrosine transport system substrate-binding protein